jgi:selenocysteine-specific translation elongation factor
MLLLKGTSYEKAKIVEVSGLTGKGIDELKRALQYSLSPPVRQWIGPFKMPIDHAFTIAGVGTVITGTIHRGKIKVKDEATVVIKEIPPTTTTDSLIGSIEDASRKGKIKVKSITY